MASQVVPLFAAGASYTNVNKLVSLIVDNMPFEGTWFNVTSGLNSDIIFPDFNISLEQANSIGSAVSKSDVPDDMAQSPPTWKDSLLTFPKALLPSPPATTPTIIPTTTTTKFLDISGSPFDASEIKIATLTINLGSFININSTYYSVPNDKTNPVKVDIGRPVTEFIDPSIALNPAFQKALAGQNYYSESPLDSSRIPKISEFFTATSIDDNSNIQAIEKGDSNAYAGPNKALKTADAKYFNYTFDIDLPIVDLNSSASTDRENIKLYYKNEVPSEGLPHGSYTYKTTDGFEQPIGYKQSYDLADYYVAYNPGQNESLAYSSIEYAPAGASSTIQKEYKYLTDDPITARKTWDAANSSSTNSQQTPSAIGLQSGLKDLVLRVYGDLAYQLSAAEEIEIQTAENGLISDLTGLANKIKASYLDNPVFKDDPLFANEAEGDAQFIYRSVASSLYQMATVIYYNYTQLVNPSSYTYTIIKNAHAEATSQSSNSDSLAVHQKAIGDLYGQLSSAQLDWKDTVYQNFGDVDGSILNIPPYVLPWDAKFYQEYKNIRLKGNYDTFFNKIDVSAYFQQSLQDALRYLIDLGSLNKGNKYTHNTPDAFTKLVGDTDVPYGVKINTFPRPEGPQNSSVSIEIQASKTSNTASSESSSLSIGYSAEVGYSGLFVSADAESSGEYNKSNSLSNAVKGSTNTDISITYSDMGQQPISLGSEWFKPEILAEAWQKRTTRNHPDWEGGFGFYSPDDQLKYITSSLYYVSNYAFGDQDMSIKISTKGDTSSHSSKFNGLSTNSSVSAKVGFGPFHASAQSSVSTSHKNRRSAFHAQSTSDGMQITAQPLKAYDTEAIKLANGNPKMLVAVEVKQIGKSGLATVESNTSTTSSSPRKFRSSQSLDDNMTDGSNNSAFTIASPHDYAKDGKNHYKLGSGHDHHFGGNGKDIIKGGSGDDNLIGSFGNDILNGGSGSDVLYGGQGKNKLKGGPGSDHFVFEKHNINNGTKHIVLDPSTQDIFVFSGYDPDEIKGKGSGRIMGDGKVIAILKGADEQLTQLLIADAIFN